MVKDRADPIPMRETMLAELPEASK